MRRESVRKSPSKSFPNPARERERVSDLCVCGIDRTQMFESTRFLFTHDENFAHENVRTLIRLLDTNHTMEIPLNSFGTQLGSCCPNRLRQRVKTYALLSGAKQRAEKQPHDFATNYTVYNII